MQIPVAIPPNLDPAMAKQVIEYLKANPEAAQQSYEQAHRMLRTPGMAQMMLDAKVSAISPSTLLPFLSITAEFVGVIFTTKHKMTSSHCQHCIAACS